MLKLRAGAYLRAVIFGLPLLWILGFHVNDVARVSLLLILITTLQRRRRTQPTVLAVSRGEMRLLRGILAAYAIYLVAEPWLSVYLGRQADDFLVFTQVVDSIVRRGAPLTSVIEAGTSWVNFLWHHFAPFLYVPAALQYAGLPAYGAISLVHGAGAAIAGIFFYKMARRCQFEQSTSLILTVLVAANPTIRHSLFFGVHDEVFALPFLAAAFWAWSSGRPVWALAALVGAATTKESLPLVGIAFVVMMVVDQYLRIEDSSYVSSRRFAPPPWPWAIAVTTLLMVVFLAYFFAQPQIVGKNFDHFAKLASFSELWNLTLVGQKAYFLSFLGLPVLFCPGLSPRSWHLLLPAAPLVGIVLISRFDEMWKPMNYYGVLPSYMVACAALLAAARSAKLRQFIQDPTVLAVLMALAFAFSGKKPAVTVYDALRLPLRSADDLKSVPSAAKIVATPAAALLLLRTTFVMRLVVANATQPKDFDFIVVRAEEDGLIAPALKQVAPECYKSDMWIIRCNAASPLRLTPAA